METKNTKAHQIYAILHDDRVVYVGRTTLGKHRWVCHKTKARNLNQHSRWIHQYMNENTCDPSCFPEFTFEPLCETKDEDIAMNLEEYFQTLFSVPKVHTRPIVNEYTKR